MPEVTKKCKHNREAAFCCKCHYGNTGHHHESPDDEHIRDLVDEFNNTTIKQKLKDGGRT